MGDTGPEAVATKDQGFSSEAYWTRRYRRGRNSGAGSYGRLADYKADYINGLVKREKIKSVIEFGSGDGNQASLFGFAKYTGIDVSSLVVESCKSRFADRKGWAFDVASGGPWKTHDLAMSLDVIYHLIEDKVFDAYMRRLFDHAGRFVLIYASDHDAAAGVEHVRHRAFSAWISEHRPDWALAEAPPHPYPYEPGSDPNVTSFASFKLFRAPASMTGIGG